MTKIHTLDSLELKDKKQGISIIFGGTFDPVHEGHIKDIKSLLKIAETLIIAPTVQNPWKDKSPVNIRHRIEMLSLALASENISFFISNEIIENGVYILNFPYTYSVDLLKHLKKYRSKLYWAIGEDLLDSAQEWKKWKTDGTDFIVLPLLDGFSATKVRDQSLAPLPSIKDYIKNNELYE